MNSILSFHLKDGMVWVSAQVNGHKLDGILDSDSEQTFLDTQTADRLGRQKQDGQSSPSFGRVETKTGPITFDLGSSVLVASRPKILPIRNHLQGMDFILGFDALGKTPFTVDYSKNMIRLGNVPQGHKVPFLPGKDVPSSQVTFSNLAINSVIDTGAPPGLDLPFSWVKSRLPSVQFKTAVERKDLGPRYEALPFLLNQVKIGEVKISNVNATAIRLKAKPLEGQGDDWATVGNNLLSRFTQVGIDGPNRNCVFVS